MVSEMGEVGGRPCDGLDVSELVVGDLAVEGTGEVLRTATPDTAAARSTTSVPKLEWIRAGAVGDSMDVPVAAIWLPAVPARRMVLLAIASEAEVALELVAAELDS